MAHECEYCGMRCTCDCDDMQWSQPRTCRHIGPIIGCAEARSELYGHNLHPDAPREFLIEDESPDLTDSDFGRVRRM